MLNASMHLPVQVKAQTSTRREQKTRSCHTCHWVQAGSSSGRRKRCSGQALLKSSLQTDKRLQIMPESSSAALRNDKIVVI